MCSWHDKWKCTTANKEREKEWQKIDRYGLFSISIVFITSNWIKAKRIHSHRFGTPYLCVSFMGASEVSNSVNTQWTLHMSKIRLIENDWKQSDDVFALGCSTYSAESYCEIVLCISKYVLISFRNDTNRVRLRKKNFHDIVLRENHKL